MGKKGIEEISDKNLFMICERLDDSAVSELSDDYSARTCREDELDIWKRMPFDDAGQAEKYQDSMADYFIRVYAPKGNLFFEKCLFVCDDRDHPIATGFIWKAYEAFNTIHWLKVLKRYEGKGIGRALLSIILGEIEGTDYPVYLHTQPSSYRAVKLYSDFGFKLLTDQTIGNRKNDVEECLPNLAKHMTDESFRKLRTAKAPKYFLKRLETENDIQF